MSIWTLAFKTRNVLAAAPLAFCFLCTYGEWEYDPGIWSIAVILCLSGAALRGWARCHCNFARRKKKVLATTGPYAFSRNPLYVGNILVIAGAGVASELEWFLPILIAWAFAVYNAGIRHEEKVLLRRYGEEYLAYRARVPAWFSFALPTRADLVSPEFARVAGLQVVYALLALIPFVIKEANPFSLWH